MANTFFATSPFVNLGDLIESLRQEEVYEQSQKSIRIRAFEGAGKMPLKVGTPHGKMETKASLRTLSKSRLDEVLS